MLKCLVGLIEPTQGMVRVCGREPGVTLNKSTIGFMPQELALYDEFNVIETLRYFGHLHSMDKRALDRSVDFLIDFLGLTEYKSQYVNTLR